MFQLEVFVGLSVLIWVLIVWLQKSRANYWKKHGVSYIPGLPLIGCGFTFNKSIGEFFAQELYNDPVTKNEPFSGFYFFNQPSLLIRDPELIKKILVKDFNVFMDRIASSDPDVDAIGNSMLPLTKGEKWKKIRTGLTPVFTTMRIKNFFTIVKDISREFERKLAQETTMGWNEYDVKRLSGFFTVDTIAQCFFGVKSDSLSNPQSPFFVNAVAMTKFTWQRAIMFFSLLFFPGFAKKMKFTFFMSSENTFLRESITTVMSQREKMGIKCNDLIDILISMKNTQQDIFHGDVLVGQAAAFLFAGYETSSSATSFALYLLAKHPDIQERVRREILEQLEKTGDITFEGINDLQYLSMVIQETLRLYPSLMVLDRVCVDDNSYSLEPQHSFSIPKGMPVYIPTLAIHRDPNIYQNPETFDPERFHNISNDLMFLSFGLGPRTCIGGRFGMIQVKMALISILKSYKVECCANTVSKITFDPRSFLMQSKDPINLIFRKL